MTRGPKPVKPVYRRGKAVVWGCTEHRTSAGQPCHWCAQQGELFDRTDASTPNRRKTP